MDLLLDRLIVLPTYTLGSLFVNGEWQCFTREAGVRKDNVFVAGESALPSGLYTVSIPPSRIFGRFAPLIVSSQLTSALDKRGVAMGMRILPGHHLVDYESGITLGQSQGPKMVHRTKAAYEAFMVKAEEAVRDGEAIELEIRQ